MSETLTLRVLWASMFGSVGLFALVATFLPPAPPPAPGPLPFILAAVALSTAVMSFVVPAQVFKTGALKAGLEVDEVPDPNAAAGFGSVTRVRVFHDPSRARSAARAMHRSSFIVSLALSEAVGLFGLVLNRLGHPLLLSVPFFVASALLVVLRFPREGAAERHLERALGARFLD